MLSAKLSKNSSVIMLLLSADKKKGTFQIYKSLIQSNTIISKIIHTDLISKKSMLMRYPAASFSVLEYDAVALYTLLCMGSSVMGRQPPPSYSLKICWFLEDGSIFGLLLSRVVAGLHPQLLLPCAGCKRLPRLTWAHQVPSPSLGDRWWTRMRRPWQRCCAVAVGGLCALSLPSGSGLQPTGKRPRTVFHPRPKGRRKCEVVFRGPGEGWQGDPGLGRQSQLDALDGSAEHFHLCSWLDISA